jgi:DNA-binding MarR family transcriptional regulator
MQAARDSRWMPAWMALIRTHTRLWDQVEVQMRRDHGLTMARCDVLAHLDMASGRLGLSDLATSVALSPSGLSKLLDRMQASGLVRRDPDPRDARAAFAAITPQGKALVTKARHDHHLFLRGIFGSALDDSELTDVTRIMNKISGSGQLTADCAPQRVIRPGRAEVRDVRPGTRPRPASRTGSAWMPRPGP